MDEIIVRGPELKLPDKSFGKVIYESLKNGRNKIAMVNAATDETQTYHEIYKKSLILSQYFHNIGLKKNDCISICSENSLNYAVPVVAALYLGICVAPMCPDLTQNEIAHLLKLAKPKIIFCTNKTYGTVLKTTDKRNIILLDSLEKTNENIETFDNLLKQKHQLKEPIDLDVNENAVILFSSGTTGLPKGVILTHRSINAALTYNLDPNYGDFNPTKIGLATTAFYFGFGFLRLLSMLVSNMKQIIIPKFNFKLFLESIQKYRITNIFLTPTLVLLMARSPLVSNYNLSSIEEIMSGASALSPEIQQLALKRLKMTNIRQGYGLTETLAISLTEKNSGKNGGRLVPGRMCKIVDKSGISLGPFNQGEVCVKGPHGMKQYVDSDQTSKMIDADGWYHTGDAGYFDQDGLLFIVDRYKELIKFKGFQVAPAEIEALLLCHSQVVDCAVVGKTDIKHGELSTGFVVKHDKSNIDEDEVMLFVKNNVSYHKWLHGGVLFVDEIPRNPTGKILRRLLKQQLNNITLTSKL